MLVDNHLLMKYIQTYFEAFRDSGMNTCFQIHRFQGARLLEAHEFDHCFYDGVSAVLELARRYPATGFKAPPLSVASKPGFLKRLWELVRWYARFFPFKPTPWKQTGKVIGHTVSAVTLLEDWRPESLTVLLLKALDTTSRPYLQDPVGRTHWMSPVGLYANIDRELPPANRVSFVDLKLIPTTSPEELRLNLREQLKELNYWGTVLTMAGSVMFGRKAFAVFARYLHHFFRRTGTFSNLGDWTIPGLEQSEWWALGQGCVAPMSPVEGTAIVVNGQLGLSVTMDPSLGLTKEDAQRFVADWKKNYLAYLRQS